MLTAGMEPEMNADKRCSPTANGALRTDYRRPLLNQEEPGTASGRNQNSLAQRRGGAESREPQPSLLTAVPASLRET
jgi:hypothetical protein